MAEKRPVKALVAVKKAWTKSIGMSALFRPTDTSNEDMVEVHIIPVSRYDLSDGTFLEIEYYPRVLEDKWARVFIPKDQILGILVFQTSDEYGKIGY